MPITPGATGADFDVLLAFSLDEEANKRVQARTSTIEEELKRIQGEAKKTGQAINTAMQGTEKKAEAAQKSVAKVGAEMAKLGGRAKQSSTQVNQALDSSIRKFKELEAAAGRAKQKASQISSVAARGAAISGQALLTGGAIVGGVLAEANRFAKEEETAGRATRATREWTQATEQLARARSRVDNVLLRESLPLLQQAARVAGQAANFIEKNPEIVQAALKTGVVLAGLGAVGLAVSKGIKLVADITYITAAATELIAAKLHNQAADKELAAAAASKITNRADDLRRAFGQTPTPTNQMSLVSAAGLIVAGIIASAAAVTWLDQLLEKSGFGQARRDAINQARDQGARIYPGALPGPERQLQAQLNRAQLAGDTEEVKRLRDELNNLGNQTGQTASDIQTATGQIAGSANEQAIVGAFTQWKEDDARLIREAAENRKQILAYAEREIAEITRNFAAQRTAINQRFNESRSSLISSYSQDMQQAEQQYAASRAQIIEDAGVEIERIEERHQENIRKMTLDHAQRREDLTAARDALGLLKEDERFDRDRAEAERETNREIAQRRQDIARRLADLAEQYAAERAQRQAQFQQQLAENEKRRQEELKQAAAAFQEQMKKAQESRAQQLRELQEALNAERIRRREVFLAEIRDLDAYLLGDRALRQQKYAEMLADAQAFFDAYRRTMPSGSSFSGVTGTTGTIPTRDSGGYADKGLYRMAWNGQREFVMSGATTRAAERLIGGQISQDGLVRALTAARSMRQANYIDQRKLYQSIPKDMLVMMEKLSTSALETALGE